MAGKFGFIYGAFDILREADMTNLEKATQLNLEKGNQHLGIGVLDSELIEDGAVKTTEDRMEIMLAFRGVDFVFRVTREQLEDREKMRVAAEQAYQEFLKTPKKPKDEGAKKYKAVYLPGTWDLFHLGHLRNIRKAIENGLMVFVGAKSDELVYEHKNRRPILQDEERMSLLRHLKGVTKVIKTHSRNPQIAIDLIGSLYEAEVEAICIGSDLKADFEAMREKIDPKIDIIYTDRDENEPSTTKDRKKLMQISGYTSLSGKMTRRTEAALVFMEGNIKER